MSTRGDAERPTPEGRRLPTELCGVIGDASDSEGGGYPKLPLPAEDAGDAGDVTAAAAAEDTDMTLECGC
jgi:hypothetical protein